MIAHRRTASHMFTSVQNSPHSQGIHRFLCLFFCLNLKELQNKWQTKNIHFFTSESQLRLKQIDWQLVASRLTHMYVQAQHQYNSSFCCFALHRHTSHMTVDQLVKSVCVVCSFAYHSHVQHIGIYKYICKYIVRRFV